MSDNNEMTDNDMPLHFALDDTDDEEVCEICGGVLCEDDFDVCEDCDE